MVRELTMDADGEVAPAVQSILSAAEGRGGSERLNIDARSLPEAFAVAETEGCVPTIAEVKPTSPTTAGQRAADPVALAEAMVAGGAAALSVLTEPEHFGGSPAALQDVRDAVDVPVLRKDFLLEEAHLDVVEADLVLLIARFLGDDLPGMIEAARDRGFQPLVEVHTREELDRATGAGADIVGVNNRDLAHLTVDLGTYERVTEVAPEDITLIAESGIGSGADVRRMRTAGADGILVGSAIMEGVEPGDSGARGPETFDIVTENTAALVESERGATETEGDHT
jgi:indole-3-glycerol phosphate synthase